MKKIILSLIFFTLIFLGYHSTNQMILSASDNEIQLILNGRRLDSLLSPPVISNDFTLVPARDVFEEFGADVDWDEETRHIYIIYEQYFILLQIDNSVALINNSPTLMDVLPQIINGRTMIPVRFVSEQLGFIVDWDEATRSVFINTDYGLQQDSNQSAYQDSHHDTHHGAPPTINEPSQTLPPTTGAANVGEIPARDVSPAPLIDMDFPLTYITNIHLASGIREGIDIFASSEISRVRTMLLPDNRLAIDFYNAEMNTTATEFIPVSISSFRQARIAQFQITPQMITRVVIELQSGVHYSITMSSDRRTLSIDFERNYISNFTHHSSGIADYITITGTRAPSVNVSHFSGPDRLIVDIPFANTTARQLSINSRFLNHMNVHNFTYDSSQVVLELNNRVSFNVSYLGNQTVIRITDATHRGVYYDNHTGILRLAISNFVPLHANSISITDSYLTRQTIITLPGDFSSIYGFGSFEINDTNMRNFEIETINGITRITANARLIRAARVSGDGNYIYISLGHPRDVYNRIVVIDPGHGGSDPGTTSIHGIREKYLVLDVSLKLLELFNTNSDIRVYMTRHTDATVSRTDRAALANEVGADMLISVHMNSVAPNQGPSGTETLYYPDAGFGRDNFTSQQMAVIFQRHVRNTLGTIDRRLVPGSWDVLRLSNMPAIISELGFLSNPDEATRLQNPAVQQLAAQALFNATMEIFNNYNLR